jgi:hypothetical protein
MLFREIIAVYYENHTEQTNVLCAGRMQGGVFTPCESCWDAEVCERGDYATIKEAVFYPCRAEPLSKRVA